MNKQPGPCGCMLTLVRGGAGPSFDQVPTQSLLIGDQFSQENVNQSIKMDVAIGQVGDGFGESNP